jgi:hypothetical protein
MCPCWADCCDKLALLSERILHSSRKSWLTSRQSHLDKALVFHGSFAPLSEGSAMRFLIAQDLSPELLL